MRKFIYYIILIATFEIYISCNDPNEPVVQTFNWETSTPEAQNANKQILDSAIIIAGKYGYVDGLLVIRNGKIILEEYFNRFSKSTSHNIKSCSKSFLSAMIGIALNKKIIPGIEKKVLDYFPEYIYQGMDQRKYNITIQHLLTMRMGIDAEENIADSVYHNTQNWIKATLELPLLSDPGEKYRYNTLETHLLSAILTRASGISTMEFAEKYLLNPMGITVDGWLRDPQGIYFGGSEMFFTPREMAVFGHLYMNDGMLNGIQIVPSDWIDSSYSRSWPKDSKEWGVLKDYNYGFLWWLGKINGYSMYWALGYGGQTILTFPELNLIVVTTAGYNIGYDVDQERPILEIVSKYVLPAVNK